MASLCKQEPARGDPFHRPNKRHRTDTRVPPGWSDCPNLGKKISCIIPSKVPLDETFNREIPNDKRYSFQQLKHLVPRNLGLVIDLTNTSRYYSVRELKNTFDRVDHVNIPCRGHSSVPNNDSVNKFVYEVEQFKKYSKEGKCILVHCTHGFNRTGYMIVHYLMRTFGESVSVAQAINIFADARPPGIYKQEYINALYTFYHEEKPKSISYPLLPKWKDELHSVPENVDAELVKSDGDAIPWKQQEELRRLCYELLGLGSETRCSRFPGSHPVSLDLKNQELLRRQWYSATWKADGTRYMMLITKDGCYLIDRKFDFRRVQMRFPRTGNGDGAHHMTLLDGEMVIDTIPPTVTIPQTEGKNTIPRTEHRFLVYDMMALNGVSIVMEPFRNRWKKVETEVIGPRNCERQNIIEHIKAERMNIVQSRKPACHYYRYEEEPFRVRRKEFFELSIVPNILEKFIPTLSHKADGLIFQAWGDPYKPHAHPELLKWKYPEMNSVDFLFRVDRNRHQLYLSDRGQKKLLLEEQNAVVFEDGSDPMLYSGKIIECARRSEDGKWVFMRVRDDKDGPNGFGTYKSVEKSIEDNITEEMLKGEIKDILKLPIYADRMQRQSNLQHHPNAARHR